MTNQTGKDVEKYFFIIYAVNPSKSLQNMSKSDSTENVLIGLWYFNLLFFL